MVVFFIFYYTTLTKAEIMTYAVTVLRQDSGMIEWVTNTRTLRDIIRSGYVSKNIVINVGLHSVFWNQELKD